MFSGGTNDTQYPTMDVAGFPNRFCISLDNRLSTFGWPCNHWPYSHPYDI